MSLKLQLSSSYFLYGTSITGGGVLYSMETEDPSISKGVEIIAANGSYLGDVVTLVNGKAFIFNIAVSDFGALLMIVFSLMAGILKALYDYSEWRKRAKSREDDENDRLRRKELEWARELEKELESEKASNEEEKLGNHNKRAP